jgi:hypothetical protein
MQKLQSVIALTDKKSRREGTSMIIKNKNGGLNTSALVITPSPFSKERLNFAL